MDQLFTILKTARAKTPYSQKDMGDKIGISQRAYAFYEDGTRRPKWPRLKKIGEILGLNEEELWKVHSENVEVFVTGAEGHGDEDQDEMTPRQILSVLAKSLDRYSRAHESQSDTIKIQASILEDIKNKMALEITQSQIEKKVDGVASSLAVILVDVQSISSGQKGVGVTILHALEELQQKESGSLVREADNRIDQIEKEAHRRGNAAAKST